MKITNRMKTSIQSDDDMYRYIKPVLDDLGLPRKVFAEKYENFEIPTIILNMRFSTHSNETLLHLIIGICAKLTPESVINATNFLKFLLVNHADPNIKADGGYTALHYAAELHEIGCLNELIRANADLNALDDELLSVLDYVFEYCKDDEESKEAAHDVSMMLVQHGAKYSKDLMSQIGVDNRAENSDADSANDEELQFRLEELEQSNQTQALEIKKLTKAVESLNERLSASISPPQESKVSASLPRKFLA